MPLVTDAQSSFCKIERMPNQCKDDRASHLLIPNRRSIRVRSGTDASCRGRSEDRNLSATAVTENFGPHPSREGCGDGGLGSVKVG